MFWHVVDTRNELPNFGNMVQRSFGSTFNVYSGFAHRVHILRVGVTHKFRVIISLCSLISETSLVL